MKDIIYNAAEKLKTFSTDRLLVHLSHNDMDGYGATYVVNTFFFDRLMIQDNTNYGEIISKLKEIGLSKNSNLLITDINLTLEEAKWIDENSNDWCVIDHHGTGADGADVAAEYPNNYFLDTTRCGTLLTFHTLNSFAYNEGVLQLEDVCDMINAYDIYKTESPLFRKGMLLANYVKANQFQFKTLTHNYMEFVFEEVAPFLLDYGVQETEIQYPRMFLRYLKRLNNDANGIIKDQELIPSNVQVAMLHEPLIRTKITFQNDEIVVFENVSTSITQYVNELLFNAEFGNKVLINLNKKGWVAFRSINEESSKFAVKAGGGGHENASGANLKLKDDEVPLDILLERLEISRG